MNYTNNYHLPQWEKSDRVLMEDFNQMCADLENGFGQLDVRTQDQAFLRLCRLAYNHYGLLRDMETTPMQDGVFYQDTAKSGEGISGMAAFDGHYALNYTQDASSDDIFAAIRQTAALSNIPNSGASPLVARFTAPCNGTIEKLNLKVTSTVKGDRLFFQCQAVCTDCTTGEVVKTTSFSIATALGTNLTYRYWTNLGLKFHCGHEYEIRVNPTYSAEGTVAASLLNEEDFLATNAVTESTGGVRHRFDAPTPNTGALVLAQFTGTDTPRLLWNGEDVPVYWTRELEGRREVAFLRRQEAQDGDEMQLVFNCPWDQEVIFYEWGAMLL